MGRKSKGVEELNGSNEWSKATQKLGGRVRGRMQKHHRRGWQGLGENKDGWASNRHESNTERVE